MNTEHELLAALRSARPVEPASWAGSETNRRIRTSALTVGARDDAPSPTGRARGRRTRSAVTLAGAVVLGGGAAVAGVVFQADSPTVAGCYTSLSPDSNMTEAAPERVEAVGAEQACAETWEATDPDVDSRRLVTCLNEFGGRGVFPVPATVDLASACSTMGWQREQ